jgi:hypothetical protein
VMYTMQLPACYDVTASLCGSNYDTYLDIRTGLPCPGATLVTCNDDNFCGITYVSQSTVHWHSLADSVYRLLIHGYNGAAGSYVLNVTGTPCPVAPPPVVDMVTQFDIASGDVVLSWAATPGASLYNVYRSTDFATLFDPASLIASVTDPGYTCAGCINDAPRAFFGVIAANAAVPAVPASADRDLAARTKAEAVQGTITVSADDLYPEASVERAAPNKAAAFRTPEAPQGPVMDVR